MFRPLQRCTWPTNGSVLAEWRGHDNYYMVSRAMLGGGVIGGVEVSVDGGKTWHPSQWHVSGWTYTWTPNILGTITLQSRATDDSANTGTSILRERGRDREPARLPVQ